jgi:hypothetical protein
VFSPARGSVGDRLGRRSEPELRSHDVPLRLDLLEPLHPELVHGLRIEIEAGPAEDLGLVHPLTARERGHADRPGGRGEVLIADDVTEPRVGGVQDVAHGGRDPLLHRRVVAQREHRRRIVRRQREDPIELRERALGDDPGRDDARGDRLARDLDRGVQHLGERPEPRLVAIDPLGRVGALEGRDLGEQRAGPVHVVHDLEAVDPLFDPSERAFTDRPHHVDVGTVRVVERRQVESRERRQRLARGLFLLGAAGRSDVGESVVEALVPDEGPHQRVALEEPFPIAIHEVRTCSLAITDVPSRASQEAQGTRAVDLDGGAREEADVA